MRQPIEITFGERSFTIRPLTLSQLQKIEAVVVAQTKGRTESIETGVAIIGAALVRDFPDTKVDDVAADISEVTMAMRAILELGGFTTVAPGESEAGADKLTGSESAAA